MIIATKENAFLLVEGSEDRDVFSELRDIYKIPRTRFRIKVAGSISELNQLLTEELLGCVSFT